MKQIFQIGDRRFYERTVRSEDKAHFEDGGTVHEVYATFNLARDAEWSTRLFVLEMKDADEEGIGTFIEIKHSSPTLIGSKVLFIATIEEINGHEIICSFKAHVGERLIASGRTGQKLLKKEKLNRLLNSIG
ncbi:MAG: hypothetical protein WAT52_12000 [Chitinophagales bacterium]